MLFYFLYFNVKKYLKKIMNLYPSIDRYFQNK